MKHAQLAGDGNLPADARAWQGAEIVARLGIRAVNYIDDTSDYGVMREEQLVVMKSATPAVISHGSGHQLQTPASPHWWWGWHGTLAK